jgi:hypothetical protein
MRQMLLAIGPRVTDAGKAIEKCEAVSLADCLRRAAFTNNKDAVMRSAPALLCDSLQPDEFDLHAPQKRNGEMYATGPATLPARFQELQVIGGCMMQLRRTSLPATVLVSKADGVVAVNVDNAPLAVLEAEMYDSAFDPPEKSWEAYVLGNERGERMLAHRKEAAIKGRTRGCHAMPKTLLREETIRVSREGVLPYLNLRIAHNQTERAQVRAEVASMLGVLAPAASTLSQIFSKAGAVHMVTLFHSGATEATPAQRDAIKDRDDDLGMVISSMLDEPVLAPLALLLLGSKIDGAVDSNGETISEAPVGEGLERYYDTETVLLTAMGTKECEAHRSARERLATMLERRPTSTLTLPAVMHGLGRKYDIKVLAKGDCVRSVAEKVAVALFGDSDPSACCAMAADAAASAMALPTALSIVAKHVTEAQAFVVVTRESDGRISAIRLFNENVSIPNVGRQALARLVLCTWAFVLVVDDDKVSQLLVKDEAATKGVAQLQPQAARLRAAPPVAPASASASASASAAAAAAAAVTNGRATDAGGVVVVDAAPHHNASPAVLTTVRTLRRTIGEIQAINSRLAKRQNI